MSEFNIANTVDAVTKPNRLLDTLIAILDLKNDAALSRALGVHRPMISKIRCQHAAVGPTLLIRMHELSGLSIRDLKNLSETQSDFDKPCHSVMPDSSADRLA
jgi:hypothetical protein